jgi:hypothetical protein
MIFTLANFGNIFRSGPCSAGYYMTDTGCQQCGENTFSGDGALSCTSCPDGTISAAGSAFCSLHDKDEPEIDFLITPGNCYLQ